MDFFSGFMMLEEKKDLVFPILAEYDFSSILAVVFSITSWRNNRGAQESCLALNSAIADIKEWGKSKIESADDFKVLFDKIFPFLKCSCYDDPVLPDFGEIRLNYCGKYYSVITGTGHTVPVFSALQFLEKISELTSMDSDTVKLLEYSDYTLNCLKDTNALVNDDILMTPQFELPTFEYFESVKRFIVEGKWRELGTAFLSRLSTDNNDIVHSHFFMFNGDYYPLFNPSLVIDFQTSILSKCSNADLHRIVNSALSDKLALVFDNIVTPRSHIIRNGVLLKREKVFLEKNKCIAYLDNKTLIIFLNCENIKGIDKIVNQLIVIYKDNELSIADCEDIDPHKGVKAYHIDKGTNLYIICYNDCISVEDSGFHFFERAQKRVYTAIDLMYMVMFASKIIQIAEFDLYDDNVESQVFSWGGMSDYFTLYLREKGVISKGACEYDIIYTEVDTAATYILSQYLKLSKVFPFHLSSTLFAVPECWNIISDDNSIYQLFRKPKELTGGALFKYSNGCTVFLSYNILSLLKGTNTTQVRLSLNLFRGIVERFFVEFHDELSTIVILENTLVQFVCQSVSNQNNDHYIFCQQPMISSNNITIDFEVNCDKIMADIAESKDRTVEQRIIKEIIYPIVSLSECSFSNLFEKMALMEKRKKTISSISIEIEHYFNPNTYEIKETETSDLSVRKQIAIICTESDVHPGVYARKKATSVVRKIQEKAVNQLEHMIQQIDREKLHSFLLSALATEQLSINLNKSGAVLSEDIDETEKNKSLNNTILLTEKSLTRKIALVYLLETNLFLQECRGKEDPEEDKLSELLSFAMWLVFLQNSSDLCYHTDSETKLVVLDDYRIEIELGSNYAQIQDNDYKRRVLEQPYDVMNGDTDQDFFKKVQDAFYEDTGVDFGLLISILNFLSKNDYSLNTKYEEIVPNVIRINATDAINDYFSCVIDNYSCEDVKKGFRFLTIDSNKLKTIDNKTYPILPIWEREKRDNCFVVKPLFCCNEDYIYSPILLEELKKRWISGFWQFYPPFEIGLERTCFSLSEWKKNQEQVFSSVVESLLKEAGCEYTKHDVDLRREDRKGNHPIINELGDYDVIGLSVVQKKVYLIECKVLQPIGSVFEHSNQQKRFFIEDKYDEKFQKRIDYFSSIMVSFFSSFGYSITEEYVIQPYMVVNKVFSSYYKPVSFPIVTYGELKKELLL